MSSGGRLLAGAIAFITAEVMVLLCAGLFVAANYPLFVEVYFPPYPAVDTRFAPGYSEAAFQRLEVGMTRDEVLDRIGRPLNSLADPYWVYSEDGACALWDFAWLVRGVQFDERGRVVGLTAFVAYD